MPPSGSSSPSRLEISWDVKSELVKRGYAVDVAQIEAVVRRMNIWSLSTVEANMEEKLADV